MSVIGTELNILSIPGNIVLRIPKQRKVMLRFFLNKNDQFTLAAWVGKDIDYDSDKPLHILNVDVLSGYRIKPDFFLGDQKIDEYTIGRIQGELTNNPNYMVYLKPTDGLRTIAKLPTKY